MEQSPSTQYVQVVAHLAPCVGDRGETLELVQVLGSADDRSRSRANLHNLALLNLRNPTDHYRFKMANVSDRVCAERLQNLAVFETTLNQSGADLSQRGNYEPIRNILFDGRLVPDTFANMRFPQSGVLEFDYASFRIDKKGVFDLPEDILSRLCTALNNARAPWAE